MSLYGGYLCLNNADPTGTLIIFLHGILDFNLAESSMFHREFQHCGSGAGGNHAMIHIRYGKNENTPPGVFSAGMIVGGTQSWVNDAGAKWLAKYVNWFKSERARLGSREEIIIIGYSNGTNVIYKSVMSHGLTPDRILFLGAAADEEQCDWKKYRKLSKCKTLNFWSKYDTTTLWADGIGGQGCPCPDIDNIEIEKCRHTRTDVAGEWHDGGPVYSENSISRSRPSGITTWCCSYMCRSHYCKYVDPQPDFRLSQLGRWVTPYVANDGEEYWRVNQQLKYGRFVTPVFHPGGLDHTERSGNVNPVN
jgi:predicted esterase